MLGNIYKVIQKAIQREKREIKKKPEGLNIKKMMGKKKNQKSFVIKSILANYIIFKKNIKTI